MDLEKYIASGILELYVSGTLSEKENQEVSDAIQKYPKLKAEVDAIELALMKLSETVGNRDKRTSFSEISDRFNSPALELNQTSKKVNWFGYMGWAASVALLLGSLWLFNENSLLKEEIKVANTKKLNLETEIATANESAEKMKALNTILRAENIESITLTGQAISPNSYAKVYWNKQEQVAYIDVAGLPEPPPGKVYQVWSLTLDPLTPTDMGILENFSTDENKVFTLANTNDSQAFGITLEPKGGSEAPTLSQLYTLGAV